MFKLSKDYYDDYNYIAERIRMNYSGIRSVYRAYFRENNTERHA